MVGVNAPIIIENPNAIPIIETRQFSAAWLTMIATNVPTAIATNKPNEKAANKTRNNFLDNNKLYNGIAKINNKI